MEKLNARMGALKGPSGALFVAFFFFLFSNPSAYGLSTFPGRARGDGKRDGHKEYYPPASR